MFRFYQKFLSSSRVFLLAIAGLPFATVANGQNVTGQSFPTPTVDNAPAAQTVYPVCQPPGPGEYLLLVVTKTPDEQERVRRTIPASAPSKVCNYLDDVVTRVGGFTTVDTANAWARYLTESSGLSAFVTRPTEVSTSGTVTVPPPPASTATATPSVSSAAAFPQPTGIEPQPQQQPQPTTQPATTAATTPTVTTASGFSPKPLGAGYAVLVNYFNRPELAVQVQQAVAKDIGLASYGQRPYLLAIYTTDQTAANKILQSLTDRGFWAMVVDSRRVTVLKQPLRPAQPKK